jgi:molybdopterin-guanine dinucleotide biosynthesis protein A
MAEKDLGFCAFHCRIEAYLRRKLKKVNAYIMAGGMSSRMGSDKTELMWKGKRMLTHMVDIAAQLCSRVVVVGKPDVDGVAAIPDSIQAVGPAGGILAAMKDAGKGSFLVLACDMPLMTEEWLRELIARSASHRVTLTKGENGLEPLCAVYSAELADAWQIGLAKGIRKLTDLISFCETDFGVAELTLPINKDILLNLNRPEDFTRLKQAFGS